MLSFSNELTFLFYFWQFPSISPFFIFGDKKQNSLAPKKHLVGILKIPLFCYTRIDARITLQLQVMNKTSFSQVLHSKIFFFSPHSSSLFISSPLLLLFLLLFLPHLLFLLPFLLLPLLLLLSLSLPPSFQSSNLRRILMVEKGNGDTSQMFLPLVQG